MSTFPKAAVKRFNDVKSETPAPSDYDPKLLDRVSGGASSKSERFRNSTLKVVTPGPADYSASARKMKPTLLSLSAKKRPNSMQNLFRTPLRPKDGQLTQCVFFGLTLYMQFPGNFRPDFDFVGDVNVFDFVFVLRFARMFGFEVEAQRFGGGNPAP